MSRDQGLVNVIADEIERMQDETLIRLAPEQLIEMYPAAHKRALDYIGWIKDCTRIEMTLDHAMVGEHLAIIYTRTNHPRLSPIGSFIVPIGTLQ